MNKEYLKKFNSKIQSYVMEKKIVTTKDVVAHFRNNHLGNHSNEEISQIVRFKLSSMCKDGLIERVSRGIYKKAEFKLEHEESKYFIDNTKIENRENLFQLLDSLYKGRWSLSKNSLKKELFISEQVPKTITINLNTRYTDRVEKIIEISKRMDVKINVIDFAYDSDVFLLSVAEILSSEEFDKYTLKMLYREIKKREKDAFDLILYSSDFSDGPFNSAKWTRKQISWIKRTIFRSNFKKMISEELKYE